MRQGAKWLIGYILNDLINQRAKYPSLYSGVKGKKATEIGLFHIKRLK